MTMLIAAAACAAGTSAAQAQTGWISSPPRPVGDCYKSPQSWGCTFYVQQGAPWWPKQGIPAMRGQWEKECRDISGGNDAWLAVYQYNPAWIFASCYTRWQKR